MLSSINSSSITPLSGQERSQARGLEFSVHGTQGSWKPEASEEEKAAAKAQPLSSPKQLTQEEEERVKLLQEQLESLLQELAENPSDEKKARIREIESELAKITGVKTKSRLSSMAAIIPKEKNEDENEDKKEEQKTNFVGMNQEMLETAIAGQILPERSPSNGPGLMTQMMKAAGAYKAINLTGLDMPITGKLRGKV